MSLPHGRLVDAIERSRAERKQCLFQICDSYESSIDRLVSDGEIEEAADCYIEKMKYASNAIQIEKTLIELRDFTVKSELRRAQEVPITETMSLLAELRREFEQPPSYWASASCSPSTDNGPIQNFTLSSDDDDKVDPLDCENALSIVPMIDSLIQFVEANKRAFNAFRTPIVDLTQKLFGAWRHYKLNTVPLGTEPVIVIRGRYYYRTKIVLPLGGCDLSLVGYLTGRRSFHSSLMLGGFPNMFARLVGYLATAWHVASSPEVLIPVSTTSNGVLQQPGKVDFTRNMVFRHLLSFLDRDSGKLILEFCLDFSREGVTVTSPDGKTRFVTKGS